MGTKTCYYRFPCHPAEIISCTSKQLSENTRMLRVHMIKMIADLSQSYSQNDLDEKIHIDIDDDNNIVGMDLSLLIGLSTPLCFHNSMKLGDMTEHDWVHMKLLEKPK